MIGSSLKPRHMVLLAAFAIAVSSPGWAQVSDPIVPPLTGDPTTAPGSTLAIDLIAPQRPFIFDATGSSIVSSGLNPTVYAASPSLPGAETDLQVRDSLQTGHYSPYTSSVTPRLGLSFLSDSGTNAPGIQGTLSGGSTRSSVMASETVDAGTSIDDRYHSTWGGSSPIDQPEDSSWGTKAMRVQRLGASQPGSTESSDTQSGSSLSSVTQPESLGSDDTHQKSRYTTAGSRMNRLSSTGTKDLKSRSRLPSVEKSDRDQSTASVASPTHSQTASTRPGTEMAKSDKPAENPISPLALPAPREYVFGESPFSAPGGSANSSFLNPDIFAAAKLSLPSASARKDRASESNSRKRSLRDGDTDDDTDSSLSHYGLATHAGTTGSSYSRHDKTKARKRSYMDNALDSEKP